MVEEGESMKKNPVVIFVCKDRVDALKNRVFPIGLTGTGEIDAPAQAKEYAVLLLDDAAPEIPDSAHLKMAAEPLLIIAHGGSTNHEANDIPSQIMAGWGKAHVCETFTHTSAPDSIFDEIKELISNSGETAESFSVKRSNKSQLEWLDRLAAICQIKMIDRSADIEELANETKAWLGPSFSNDFENAKYVSAGAANWEAGLAHIQSTAKRFV